MDSQKPVSVILDEFKTTLVDDINNSGLHPSIISMILKDLYIEAKDLANRQLEQETQQWKASQQVSPKSEE